MELLGWKSQLSFFLDCHYLHAVVAEGSLLMRR